MSSKTAITVALLIILALTFVAYLPVLSSGFSSLDDASYVTQNGSAKDLSTHSISKLFTGFVVGNYHPLTSLALASRREISVNNFLLSEFTETSRFKPAFRDIISERKKNKGNNVKNKTAQQYFSISKFIGNYA